jgi:hypothetical protein
MTADQEAEIVEMTLAGMSWCETRQHWVDGEVDGGMCEECYEYGREQKYVQRRQREWEDQQEKMRRDSRSEG